MTFIRHCSFDGCSRKHLAKGLCSAHYQQRRDGKELVPLRPKKAHKQRPRMSLPEGYKYCLRCDQTQPLSEYTNNSSTSDGKQIYCKSCFKDIKTVHRYVLTYVEYEAMLTIQNGGCAICSKTPEENGQALAVDHDHSCCPGGVTCGKCVRQLLCSDCNTGIGMFREDIDRMRAAIAYLESHKQSRT